MTHDPHEEDQERCDRLIVYLEGLQGPSASASESVASSGSASSVPAGVVVVSSKAIVEEGLFAGFGKKPPKAKKGKSSSTGAGASSKKALTLPLTVVSDFASVKVRAPSRQADISSTIDLLRQRKVFKAKPQTIRKVSE